MEVTEVTMPYTCFVCLTEGNLIRQYFAHQDNTSYAEACRRYPDYRLEILRQASLMDYQRIVAEAHAHDQKHGTTFHVTCTLTKTP